MAINITQLPDQAAAATFHARYLLMPIVTSKGISKGLGKMENRKTPTMPRLFTAATIFGTLILRRNRPKALEYILFAGSEILKFGIKCRPVRAV